jgi:hypothetical protein
VLGLQLGEAHRQHEEIMVSHHRDSERCGRDILAPAPGRTVRASTSSMTRVASSDSRGPAPARRSIDVS